MTSVDYGTAEIHGPDRGHEGSAEDVWARKLALKLMRFEFPLGCMLPAGMSRLVVAGRCASFTHEVDKFARNMAPIGLMGQAAGVFAAIMARDAEADWDRLPVAAVRARLQQDGLAVSLPPGAPHRAIDKIAQ